MMNVVDLLVEKFGSQDAVAKAAGCSQSAVSDWKRDNRVPSRRIAILLKNAAADGVELGPRDFFPDWKRHD